MVDTLLLVVVSLVDGVYSQKPRDTGVIWLFPYANRTFYCPGLFDKERCCAVLQIR